MFGLLVGVKCVAGATKDRIWLMPKISFKMVRSA